MGRLGAPDHLLTTFSSDELGSLLDGVKNNIPGLLEEMHLHRGAEKILRRDLKREGYMIPDNVGLVRTGPILSGHMFRFGAKMGFALHYEVFKSVVPAAGGVKPIWFSNAQAASGRLPMELLGLLPEFKTLEQGSKNVGEQFRYSWVATDDARHGFFYAVFRSSFAVGAATSVSRADFLEKVNEATPTFKPGDLASAGSLPLG